MPKNTPILSNSVNVQQPTTSTSSTSSASSASSTIKSRISEHKHDVEKSKVKYAMHLYIDVSDAKHPLPHHDIHSSGEKEKHHHHHIDLLSSSKKFNHICITKNPKDTHTIFHFNIDILEKTHTDKEYKVVSHNNTILEGQQAFLAHMDAFVRSGQRFSHTDNPSVILPVQLLSFKNNAHTHKKHNKEIIYMIGLSFHGLLDHHLRSPSYYAKHSDAGKEHTHNTHDQLNPDSRSTTPTPLSAPTSRPSSPNIPTRLGGN